MTTHDWYDVALWFAVACALASSAISAWRARFYKRLARIAEDRRCDALSHAGDLQHANEALRRANELLDERCPVPVPANDA